MNPYQKCVAVIVFIIKTVNGRLLEGGRALDLLSYSSKVNGLLVIAIICSSDQFSIFPCSKINWFQRCGTSLEQEFPNPSHFQVVSKVLSIF